MVFYTILLLLLNLNTVLNLTGSYESICFGERYRIDFEGNIKHIPREKCCEGYVQRGDTCEPHCEPSCRNSTCIAPNRCGCVEPNQMNCPNCSAGYKGADCKERCTDNTYGENCENLCECNHGDCHPESGICSCHEGWIGPTCSEECPCQNGATCSPLTNLCRCLPGFTGDYCELSCDDGYWGKNCLQQCDCGEYTCDKIDGICIFDCSCKESTTVSCDPLVGQCLCHEGWTGDRCDQRKSCPSMMYGHICQHTCKCENQKHSGCDQHTGKCNCLPGWYGETCSKKCACENGSCNEEGNCICEPGWLGKACNKICECINGICDEEGNCACEPGWQGRSCNMRCDDGSYGEGCREKCSDVGLGRNYFCHHIKGSMCKAGYTGINCTSYCPERTFGIDCKPCHCTNFVACNRITGVCECYPGWYGPTCNISCPDNYYGEKCTQTCPESCPNCRKSDGYCVCQDGWEGRNCQEYCPEEYIDVNTGDCIELPEEERKSDFYKLQHSYMTLYLSIGASVLVFVIVVAICGVTLRNGVKRKKKKSERESFGDVCQEDNNERDRYEDQPENHIYETIPGDIYNTDPYNLLIHVPMEPGYLPPRDIQVPNDDNYIPTNGRLSSHVPLMPAENLSRMMTNEEQAEIRESELPTHYRQFLREQGGRRNHSTEGVDKEDIVKKQRNLYLFNDERFAARYTPPPSINKKINSHSSSVAGTV